MPKGTCKIDACDNPHYARGWCKNHWQRWWRHGTTDDPHPSRLERLISRVDREAGGACWPWTGGLDDAGYAQYYWSSEKKSSGHRAAYELLVGPIPDGLQIDHLCRVRNCVNPDHLEPVTGRENTLRGETITAANLAKTHCPQGHPYAGENLAIAPGRRTCRACGRAKSQRYRDRKRVEVV